MLARARLELANLDLAGGKEPDELLEVATTALPTFEVFDDARALGRAWLSIGFVRGGFHCQNAAWEEAASNALTYYRREGWPTFGCLGELAAALYHGPRPADEAGARVPSSSRPRPSDRLGEAHLLSCLAGLEAFRGRFDEARELNRSAHSRYEELGAAAAAVGGADAIAAEIELLAGELDAAEHILRASCEEFERRGERAFLSTRAARLAEVLHAQGKESEALHWTRVAEENTAGNDISAQFSWRGVRAMLLAQGGIRGRRRAAG